MSWDYSDYLANKLNEIKADNGFTFKLIVEEEQIFSKRKQLESNTVFIILKKLSSNLSYNTITQPIQIYALSENNAQGAVNKMLVDFATNYNYEIVETSDELIKMSYTSPVTLSNFQSVSSNFKSVIYLTGTLIIMEGIIGVDDLFIDGIEIKPLGIEVNYAMTGNTQPIGSSKIATTVKSIATLSLSLTIPCISTYSTLISNVVNIMKGATTGNKSFTVTFKINNISFPFSMKLISAKLNDAPNEVPGLILAFMR